MRPTTPHTNRTPAEALTITTARASSRRHLERRLRVLAHRLTRSPERIDYARTAAEYRLIVVELDRRSAQRSAEDRAKRRELNRVRRRPAAL